MKDEEICTECSKLKSNIDYIFMKNNNLVDEYICKNCTTKRSKN